MKCPDCGYMMSDFDKECARCKQYAGRGLKPPTGLLIPAGIDPEPLQPGDTPIRRQSAASPAEVVYLESGNVIITSTRAVIGGKTYAMANVTSVAGVKSDANLMPALCWGFLGTATLVIGIATSAIVAVLVGAAFLCLSVGVFRSAKAKYTVRLTSASAESDALWSYDSDEIRDIVKAINEAIIRRG